MKCTKCGYLGFEQTDRCRNCGYQFSLAATTETQELPLRSASPLAPLQDLELVDAAARPSDQSRTAELASAALAEELPLFDGASAAAEPMITKASAPRTPLSVRRATPEIPRLKSTPLRTPMLDLEPDAAPAPTPVPPRSVSPRSRHTPTPAPAPAPVSIEEEPAGFIARATAAAIDLGLLAAIDVAVIYFTMQICGLTFDDLRLLPKGPLIAFLLLQNGGYLVAFNAGGQTIGKMAAGIKVVPAQANASLDFGHSFVRTLVWLVLTVPAGLGLLTALLAPDRRGLHDRCAGTKVVRDSA